MRDVSGYMGMCLRDEWKCVAIAWFHALLCIIMG